MKNTIWHPIKKWGFLVLFTYILLFTQSYQFILSQLLNKAWSYVIPPFAKLIGISDNLKSVSSGSGDGLFQYVSILFFLVLSIFVGSIIYFLTRKRSEFNYLFEIMLVFMRYYMAFQMLLYGLAKIFYLQFGFPNEMRLDQPLGDFSPMGLLWTFMGYSEPYTIFTGLAEFMGGVFLFWKRTSLLGSLITFGVMINVMMLNYCYDVPVKILSTHLVIFSLFIIIQHGSRLLDFFIRNKASSEIQYLEIIPSKFVRAKNICKNIIIGLILAATIISFILHQFDVFSSKSDTPLFEGKYEVIKFERYNEDDVLQEQYNDLNWKATYQYYSNTLAILHQNDSLNYIPITIDSIENKIHLQMNQIKADNPYLSSKMNLDYQKIDTDIFKLTGEQGTDSLSIILKKKDIEDYLLVKRKFKWVQEHPFNR